MTGDLHHVYARGVARQAIFVDDTDRHRYLALLAKTSRRAAWSCLSYCLMDNHIHFLIEAPVPNLSSGFQRLHGVYAQAFNRRHGRTGHLFEDRFKAKGVDSETQLWATVAYIVNNPVDAGMCSAPEMWSWSSHRAVLDGIAQPWLDERRLFEYLAAEGGDPRTRYADLVKGARPL